MAAIALIAGAEPLTAVGLGISMTALQVSIGTLNDIVDAPRDRGCEAGQADPGRPRVAARRPCVLAVASGGVGLALVGWRRAVRDPRSLLLGVVVLAIGYAYDLVFKGTAWSWLPFAVGIPLLPVYGWVGATGRRSRRRSPSSSRSRSSPAPPSRSPTPGPTRSAIARVGTVSVATRLGGRVVVVGRAPSCWRSSS